ncbi:MAG: hypothetical protein AAGJ87_06135, partial [Pseudomonadota bacterium]
MANKVDAVQKAAGTRQNLRDFLPERAIGIVMDGDVDEVVAKINGHLRTFALLGEQALWPFYSTQHVTTFKPDLFDVQHGDKAFLFGDQDAGDKAIRILEWDDDLTGETDFEAGVFRPLFNQDGTTWDRPGGWRTYKIMAAALDNTAGLIVGADLGDRVSFSKPVSDRGRRLDTDYIVINAVRDHPPINPNIGDAYLIPPVFPLGDLGHKWDGASPNDITWYAGLDQDGDAVWIIITPRAGVTVFDQDTQAVWRAVETPDGMIWRWQYSANNDATQIPNGSRRPNVRQLGAILPPPDGTAIEGFANMPLGARIDVHPNNAARTFRHDVDVSQTEGAAPFALDDGEDLLVDAAKQVILTFERSAHDGRIRMVGSAPGLQPDEVVLQSNDGDITGAKNFTTRPTFNGDDLITAPESATAIADEATARSDAIAAEATARGDADAAVDTGLQRRV